MAIVSRDEALRQFGQRRPGQGSLYGGPPPPAPAPKVSLPANRPDGSYDIDAILASAKSDDGGGQGPQNFGEAIVGGLGTILGGAAKGLDFVSNAGTLAFEEVAEGLMGKEFHTQTENGRLVDDRSNWDKLSDPNYGMGELLGDVTGNKWIDRTIGFVGDVALDPLTYVGGAVVKSPLALGKAGRNQLAQKALEKGLGDEVIQHVSKYGHVGLDDVTRQALDVKKAGVYWGVGDKSIRLPGTKTIGTASEKAFSKVRLNTAGRLVGKVGKGRGRKELALARQVASTGKTVDDMTPTRAAGLLNMSNELRSVQAEVAEPWAREAQEMMSPWKGDVRRSVTHEVESLNAGWTADMGDAVDPAVLAKLSPEAQQFVALRDLVYASTKEATDANIGFRGPGYVMHRSTKEGAEFLGDDNLGALLRGSLETGQDAAQERVILPGSTVKVKGRKVTFGDASIRDINEKLTEKFPEAGVERWVEDDAVALMERYIGEMSKIQGTDAMIKRGVSEGTLLGNLEAYSDEMLRTAAKTTNNFELREAFGLELVRRGERSQFLQGEADVAGAALSRRLHESLFDHLDEAERNSETLKGFRDDIAEMLLRGDGSDETLRRIEIRFQKEKGLLDAEASRLFDEIAELDANIVAANLKLGTIAEDARAGVLGKLDGWTTDHGRAVSDLADARKAGEDLDSVDEMFGLTLAQAGRLDEILDSPQQIVEMADELEQMGFISKSQRETLMDDSERLTRLNKEFDGLAEVERELGADRAEQLANADSVRSALSADWNSANQYVAWAEQRVKTLRQWRNKAGSVDELADGPVDATFRETLRSQLDDFDELLAESTAGVKPDSSLIAATRLNDEYFQQLKSMGAEGREFVDSYENALSAFPSVGEGVKRNMLDGWEALDHKLFPVTRDISVDSVLKKYLENFMSAVNDDMDLKWFDEATQVFKSYATMTPGFHLRNFMGATFMNFSDGVTVGDTRLGMKHWRGYVNDPAGYVKSLPEDEAHVGRAFQAVFGVGAGGSFSADEVGSGAARAWKGVKNNKAIRMSRRQGEDLVEGPVRLAAALNTTKRGGSVSDAMARVKRLHFDYSDLSGFDQKMKRVIPFWMFMSRNLPLQVEQMWRKPKAYAVYNHFMNNFDESDENSLMPKYLKDAGAIVMGGSWFGDDTKDFVFAPDLQHNNLMQDIMAFSGQGEQGIPIVDGLLASGNPIVTKPLEIAFNHSGFRGGDAFFDKKQDRYGNWVDKSAQEKALERLMYGVEGVFTPTGTAKGLLGIDPLGSEESQARSSDRQLQKALNYAGLPFKQLGDYERDYERRRQGREGE